MAIGVFRCDRPGENSFATSELGLPVDGQVQINCNTYLRNIITFQEHAGGFPGGGWVESIVLKRNTGPIYDYVLEVYGEGPRDGCGYLKFWDMTGDYYRLSICAKFALTHTVRFNSDNPIINKIEWRSSSF